MEGQDNYDDDFAIFSKSRALLQKSPSQEPLSSSFSNFSLLEQSPQLSDHPPLEESATQLPDRSTFHTPQICKDLYRELSARALTKAQNPNKHKILSNEFFVSSLVDLAKAHTSRESRIEIDHKLYLDVIKKDIQNLSSQERPWYKYFSQCLIKPPPDSTNPSLKKLELYSRLPYSDLHYTPELLNQRITLLLGNCFQQNFECQSDLLSHFAILSYIEESQKAHLLYEGYKQKQFFFKVIARQAQILFLEAPHLLKRAQNLSQAIELFAECCDSALIADIRGYHPQTAIIEMKSIYL